MGIYNFQAQFVPHVVSGRKTQTIRAIRRHPDSVGNTLHLYTGLRQRGATLLKRVQCVEVRTIEISPRGVVVIDDVKLGPDERQKLAFDDGFESFSEMMAFWAGRLPFKGHLLTW